MRTLSQTFVARHDRGGVKCFWDHHPEVAPSFPEFLWSPMTDYLVRAQWCVIAGANRMERLNKPQLLSHSGNAFKSILVNNPILKGLCMPSMWWPSVIKRGVNTLWPQLLKFEALGARPSEPTFRCDWCAYLTAQRKKSA